MVDLFGPEVSEIPTYGLLASTIEGCDVIIYDTAGRLSIDEELMAETAAIEKIAQPHETLLVADALTGQDAINLAKNFGERVDLSGWGLYVTTLAYGDLQGGDETEWYTQQFSGTSSASTSSLSN